MSFFKDKDGILSISEVEQANEHLIRAINLLRCALIIVDFQNDFISGSLSIKVFYYLFKQCIIVY